MKTILNLAFAAALLVGCTKQVASKPTPATNGVSGGPLTAPVDYLGSVAKAKKSMEGTIGNVGLSQAIQQFNTVEGRFPKDLNELVEKHYLGALPKAPYQMRFDYDAQTGDVKVVSAQ